MIKYNYQTGILECCDNIKDVEKFIKEYMGRLKRIHCGSRSRASKDPKEDSKRRNHNNARMAGLKNSAQWNEAVSNRTLEYWHYYTEENNKITPNPFNED